MRHIGNIIRNLREDAGISRKELSKGICTDKYVYLIEKGDRTPSSSVLYDFSNRLGVDLFEYYRYVDCKEPVKVYKYIETFKQCRRTSNHIQMQEETIKALELDDFHELPWSYEIQINILFIMIFVDRQYKEAILDLEESISNMLYRYSNSEYLLNFYILLSTSYQGVGDMDKASKISSIAYEIMKTKKNDIRYREIIISMYLNKMSLYYFIGDYKRVIELSNKLNEYQTSTESYERSHYMCFFTSFAHYKRGESEKAFCWFRKGLYIMLLKYRPIDMLNIKGFDVFSIMLEDPILNKDLTNEVKSIYNKYL